MKERKDADHLRYATQQQRVLLTFNVVDFMRVVKKIPNHTGVICSVQVPLDKYSVLANAVIDKLTLITDWSRLVVWVKLK